MVNYTNQTRKTITYAYVELKTKQKTQKNIRPYNSNNSKILKKYPS